MNSLMKSFSLQRPSLGQSLHFISQLSYILILMYYIKAAKYWDWYIGSMALAYFLNFLGYKFILKREHGLNITPLVITNSVFIFITGHSFFSYALAISVAIISRFYLRLGDRPLFNASAFAVMVMLALGEGVYATPVIAMADRQGWIPLIVLFGVFTSFASNRVIASFSYWFAFVFIVLALHLLKVPLIGMQAGTMLGFFGLIFTFHVLTDPQTTPDSRKELVIFGLTLALIDILLRLYSIVASSFVALNVMTGLYACYRNQTAPLYKRVSGSLVPIAILFLGISFGYFPSPFKDSMQYDVYQKNKGENLDLTLPFKYEEKSKDLGVFIQRSFAVTPNLSVIKSSLFNAFPAPIYAVGNVDADKYADFIISGSKVPFSIYKNKSGTIFENITAQIGIKEDFVTKIVNAIFLDYNNDGRDDIFMVIGIGSENFKLYENTVKGFIDVTTNIGLDKLKNSGKVTSLELLDYDLDGHIDILISNYPIIENVGETYIVTAGYKYSRKPKQNIMLRNLQAKGFQDVSAQMNLSLNEFTHDIGVSDLNNDGFPDLYFSNDYGRDKVFYNQNGKTFSNVTFEVLGNIFNRNGMGIDFADLSGNGYQSIYVSNTSAGRFRHGMNYFWFNNGDKQFENKSDEYNISKCGYSWGPKFFDPDLDGQLDLIVGAGLRNGKNNAWYQVASWGLMPNYLKSHKITMNAFPPELEIAGNQPKCLFWKKDEVFIDVAEEAGISDLHNTKTITLLDLKNDGNPLIITGNFFHPRLLAYQNVAPQKNNWVGLKLIGTASNKQAIGAKVLIDWKNKTHAREVFPTNGITTLNDRRLIFGLEKSRVVPPIKIIWPSGKSQQVQNLKINSYNTVMETI